MILLGNCPTITLSSVSPMTLLCIVKAFTSTLVMGYFAVLIARVLAWASNTSGLILARRTISVASFMFTENFPFFDEHCISRCFLNGSKITTVFSSLFTLYIVLFWSLDSSSIKNSGNGTFIVLCLMFVIFLTLWPSFSISSWISAASVEGCIFLKTTLKLLSCFLWKLWNSVFFSSKLLQSVWIFPRSLAEF